MFVLMSGLFPNERLKKVIKTLRSGGFKMGRSGNHKHNTFFFWPKRQAGLVLAKFLLIHSTDLSTGFTIYNHAQYDIKMIFSQGREMIQIY